MQCMKGHFFLTEPNAAEQAFAFLKARNCADFQLNSNI
jgi:hypothetical protein